MYVPENVPLTVPRVLVMLNDPVTVPLVETTCGFSVNVKLADVICAIAPPSVSMTLEVIARLLQVTVRPFVAKPFHTASAEAIETGCIFSAASIEQPFIAPPVRKIWLITKFVVLLDVTVG